MKIPLQADHACPSKQHQHTQAYRVLLMAFGYPVRIHRLEMNAMQASIDCLLDEATHVSLTTGCLAWRERILATGAVLSQPPEWVFADPSLHDLTDIPAGTREAPETGATVVIAVNALSETPLQDPDTLCIRTRGAGLKTPGQLYVTGLQRGIIQDHIAWHTEYPCGVDILLCADRNVAALPRHLALEIR